MPVAIVCHNLQSGVLISVWPGRKASLLVIKQKKNCLNVVQAYVVKPACQYGVEQAESGSVPEIKYVLAIISPIIRVGRKGCTHSCVSHMEMLFFMCTALQYPSRLVFLILKPDVLLILYGFWRWYCNVKGFLSFLHVIITYLILTKTQFISICYV